MGETFQRRISALLLSNRRHARYVAAVACMAVLVAFGVTLGLTQKGQAKTHEETVLDCQYSGGGAHTHDASCYDADGNLVCPLEEREYHVHDDSCYASETYLVCGMEEGEGAHAHDESCYDEEGNLVCGLEESEGHVHTDECWQTDTYLACGKEEVTEEHVHGDGCFTTVVVTEDDPEPEVEAEPEDDVEADADTDTNADVKENKAATTDTTDDQGTRTMTAKTEDYEVTVSFGADAKIPASATLEVKELIPGTDEYEEFLDEPVMDGRDEVSTRFFDISLMDGGKEIEPSAPVKVTVKLRDVELEGVKGDEKVTHYIDEDQAESVSSKIEKVDEDVAEVTFDLASLSVVEVPLSSKAADGYTVAVGESITLTGTSNKSHEWSSSDEGVATVSGDGKTATVTGVSAGEVTITHRHKKNGSTWTTETFVVTVTEADDPGDPSGDDEETEKQLITSDYTVTVRGNKQALEGATLVVSDMDESDPDYDAFYDAMVADVDDSNGFDFLRMFHIYLTKDGQEWQPEGNYNLMVTIDFADGVEGLDAAKSKGVKVGHYGISDGSVYAKAIAANSMPSDGDVAPKKVSFSGNSVSFHIKNFSVITLSAGYTQVSGGTPIYTQPGSILVGQTIDDANAWQIGNYFSPESMTNKSSMYQGNDSQYKVSSPDGLVRLQKSVIPTGTENEFMVYLSVDISQDVIIQRILEGVGLVVTNSSWNGATTSGGKTKDSGKAEEAWSGAAVTNYEGLFIEPVVGGNQWTIHIVANGKTYELTRYTHNNTFNNGASHIKIGDTWWGAGKKVTNKGNNTLEIELEQSAIEALIAYGVDLEDLSALDNMGTESIIVESGTASIISATGTAVANVDGSAIDWTISPLHIGTTPDDGDYYTNVAELLYKVTLDVTDEDFVSGKWYKVNEDAKLTYVDLDGVVQQAEFPVPQIKGTLYSFSFKKVDQDNQPLKDAVFTLTGGTLGDEGLTVTTGVSTETPNVVVNGTNNCTVTFRNLPWGQYKLTETPPAGYSSPEGNPWTLNIGYTTDLADGTITNHTGNSTVPSDFPGVWIGNGFDWTIVNKRNKITVSKQIEALLDLDLNAIDQTIYIALWDNTTRDYVRNSDNTILVKPITIVNGQVISTQPVVFGEVEPLENHVYYVSELVLTRDVNETDIPRIPDSAYADDTHEYVYSFTNLTFTGKDADGQDVIFQVKGIDGYHWDYEHEEWSVGRDIDLSSTNNEGKVYFKNSYSPETTIEFVTRKQWRRRTISVDPVTGEEIWGATAIQPPTGATVTYTLYQSIGDSDSWSEYRTIILNGTTDQDGELSAWVATFADLPKMDTNEDSPTYEEYYHYRVKETSCPDEFEPFDSEQHHDPMGPDDYVTTSGGIIYNILKTTEITIKKVDENDAFLPGAKFDLVRTDPYQESIKLGFEVTAKQGVKIENLISGDYKLTEVKAPTGYIMLTKTLEFHVDATATGDTPVITWKEESAPENADLSRTTLKDDTITVKNTPGKALPNTGGPGTTLFTITGSAVLAMAVTYGIASRRRRERGLD